MKRLAVLVLLALAACEKSPEPPSACGPAPPPTTVNATETATVAFCFDDPNGDVLEYSAKSSNPKVATASVLGTDVTIAALAKGTTNVTVTARDPGGLTGEQSFEVKVPNRAPVAGDPISDIEMFVGEEELVDISFHDPDGDMLVVTTRTSDPGVALALVFGAAVLVRGEGPGSATVAVTAEDPEGLWAELSFEVTVAHNDRGVLEALYHATDGPNWAYSYGWLTDAPLEEWYGVETDASGRVDSLYLVDNQLTGTIPSELGDLSNLVTLDLGGNQLTGAIPSWLGDLSNLVSLVLYGNQLTGAIASELGDLSNLVSLNLGGNQLTGAIPSWLGDLSNLEILGLWGNQLTGAIPPELGDLSNLVSLYLDGNQLTGAIPSELGNLSELTFLWLNDNQLTDPIPDSFLTIGGLEWFGFQNNDGLCAPSTDDFTEWLDGLEDWSGARCE